jgi:hypothetical protein
MAPAKEKALMELYLWKYGGIRKISALKLGLAILSAQGRASMLFWRLK